MPIKKENKNRYPANWKEIAARVRSRAGNRCEYCRAENGQPHPITGSKVVLTCAHLNHTPEDVRMDNLASLCQLCHNRYDVRHRAESRRQTRAKRTGQRSLPLAAGEKE